MVWHQKSDLASSFIEESAVGDVEMTKLGQVLGWRGQNLGSQVKIWACQVEIWASWALSGVETVNPGGNQPLRARFRPVGASLGSESALLRHFLGQNGVQVVDIGSNRVILRVDEVTLVTLGANVGLEGRIERSRTVLWSLSVISDPVLTTSGRSRSESVRN